MTIRVRFAPSPTGQLHVGNARTALFNWLLARSQGGTFVLRIEDTDTERHQEGAVEAIYRDLAWLGLDWDEGPIAPPSKTGDPKASPPQISAGRGVGTFGPYRQSERASSYQPALSRLAEVGAVYPCFCSEEELEADRAAALAEGRTPGYAGRCARIPEAEARRKVAAGDAHVLRYRVGRYGVVQDLLRGSIDFGTRPAFDPVVRRRDGRPTYNFAAVVDDAAMEISHVLRGEDHLTNTALQVRLYEDLGLTPPRFAHLPLILGPDGSPLSKRHGATSVGEFRERGYPADALVNSLALLGWTPPEEKVLLHRSELVSLFSLERLNLSPAIFDLAKLGWISGQKIRAMTRRERAHAAVPFLAGSLLSPSANDRAALSAEVAEWIEDAVDLFATSIERFDELPERIAPLLNHDPDEALAQGAVSSETDRRALEAFADLLESRPPATSEDFKTAVDAAREKTGLKGRSLLHPLRVALTGSGSGPELSRLVPLLVGAARVRPGTPGVGQRIRSVLRAWGGASQ